MAGSVLNLTFGILINISAKLKVSASKSATSPSCKPLAVILPQTQESNAILRQNPNCFTSIIVKNKNRKAT